MAQSAPDRDAVTALRAASQEVFAGTLVFLVYAFGSRVQGIARQDSDLDVGYYVHAGARRPSLMAEMDMANRLSTVLGVEVDLRCLNDAPLEVRGYVLEQGVRVYCSDDVARVNLERDLLARYHDYKPEIEALRRLRLEAMAARRS